MDIRMYDTGPGEAWTSGRLASWIQDMDQFE